MKMRNILWLSVSVLLGLSGCNSLVGVFPVCENYAAPGISVRIVDPTTGSPPAAGGDIIVIATDGEYTDADTIPSSSEFPHWYDAFLAYERPGTYRVEVRAAGYEPWVLAPVLVPDDGCHVQSVNVTARMQRLDST